MSESEHKIYANLHIFILLNKLFWPIIIFADALPITYIGLVVSLNMNIYYYNRTTF